MKLSKYITLGEATKSDTAIRKGISNQPNPKQLKAMKNIAKKVFDKVRDYINAPLAASSFFRSAGLNAAIKGSSKTSQHMEGEAIDIDCDKFGNGTNKEVFYFIKDNLEFDQLIWEYGTDDNPDWVHVSLRLVGKNRKQVLRKTPVKYLPFDL